MANKWTLRVHTKSEAILTDNIQIIGRSWINRQNVPANKSVIAEQLVPIGKMVHLCVF